VVDRLENARLGSALMRWDHAEIERLADQLHTSWQKMMSDRLLTDDVERHVREVLLALHSLLILHFAKEDDVIVPLLEASISQEEADALERDMIVLERRLV
jgi:hemerythrin-like domain-containing protein